MRFAILLGILLVATPLLLRADSLDPFADATSYANLERIRATELGASILDIVPAQLLLIILATIVLFLAAYAGASEEFLIILATSPAFIVTFTTVSPGTVGAVVIALGCFFLIQERHWAVAFVPLAFLVGTNTGILASMAFITIAIMRGFPFIALGVSFFALVSSTALAFIEPSYGLGFVHPATFWSDLLIGGQGGITLFILAIGTLGFFIQYKEQRDATAFLPVALIGLAPLFENGGIVVAGALAYAGSAAWDYLASREWKFEELGSITLVLIACSILFTTIVTVKDRGDIDEDRIAVRSFLNAGISAGTPIAADKDIAGVLIEEGFRTGMPRLPSDPSFIASALREEGYAYIITQESHPAYGHFPVVFRTDSETTYTLYEVPR